jgi:hypothetical protein
MNQPMMKNCKNCTNHISKNTLDYHIDGKSGCTMNVTLKEGKIVCDKHNERKFYKPPVWNYCVECDDFVLREYGRWVPISILGEHIFMCNECIRKRTDIYECVHRGMI